MIAISEELRQAVQGFQGQPCAPCGPRNRCRICCVTRRNI